MNFFFLSLVYFQKSPEFWHGGLQPCVSWSQAALPRSSQCWGSEPWRVTNCCFLKFAAALTFDIMGLKRLTLLLSINTLSWHMQLQTVRHQLLWCIHGNKCELWQRVFSLISLYTYCMRNTYNIFFVSWTNQSEGRTGCPTWISYTVPVLQQDVVGVATDKSNHICPDLWHPSMNSEGQHPVVLYEGRFLQKTTFPNHHQTSIDTKHFTFGQEGNNVKIHSMEEEACSTSVCVSSHSPITCPEISHRCEWMMDRWPIQGAFLPAAPPPPPPPPGPLTGDEWMNVKQKYLHVLTRESRCQTQTWTVKSAGT